MLRLINLLVLLVAAHSAHSGYEGVQGVKPQEFSGINKPYEFNIDTEDPVDGPLGHIGERLSKPGFILNAQKHSYVPDPTHLKHLLESGKYSPEFLFGGSQAQNGFSPYYGEHFYNKPFGEYNSFTPSYGYHHLTSPVAPFPPYYGPSNTYKPPYRGPYSPSYSIIKSFDKYPFNHEPFVTKYFQRNFHPYTESHFLPKREYDRFHSVLNDMDFDDEKFDAPKFLARPKFQSAFIQFRDLLGNGRQWDQDKFYFFLNLLVKTYEKNAITMLKEPYTWYLLNLLSHKGDYPIQVDYHTLFKTLNNLINVEGIRSFDLLKNPYIYFVSNYLNHPFSHYRFPFLYDYDYLRHSIEEVIDNFDVDIDVILKHPNVWNVVNSLYHYRGHFGFPTVDQKGFHYYLKYLINTYGKQSNKILREPYTWYILSLINKIPLGGLLPGGVDYQTIFRSLNDVINMEGVRGEEILYHPYLHNIINLLEHFPGTEYYTKPYYFNRQFYPRFDYNPTQKKLTDFFHSNGFDIESIKDEPMIRNIIEKISKSFGDGNYHNFDKTSFDFYYTYMMKTYGKGAEALLKEPYVWYIISLLCRGPVEGYLPKGVDYQTLFRTLNDLINNDGKHGEAIIMHPYVSFAVESLLQPHIGIFENRFHFFAGVDEYPYDYSYIQKVLKEIIDNSNFNSQYILDHPMTVNVLNSVLRYYGDMNYPFVDRNGYTHYFTEYLNYIINTFGKESEYMLKEPFTWYILSLLSRSSLNNYLPVEVEYQKVFSTINDLVLEGKHDKQFLFDPYIYHAVGKLHHSKNVVLKPLHDAFGMFFAPAAHVHPEFQTFTSLYPTEIEYDAYRHKLMEIIDRSGLQSEVIFEDIDFWNVINTFQHYDHMFKFQQFDKDIFKFYVNYVIKTFGEDSKHMLSEPYTLYIIRLMSGGPSKDFLPESVSYEKVFKTLHELISMESKKSDEIIHHPYIYETVSSLRHPRSVKFSPSYPSYYHSDYPSDSYRIYPSKIAYDGYRRKLTNLIDHYGLEPESFIKDSQFWEIVNSFDRYDRYTASLPLDGVTFKYYTNYLIKTYGRRADDLFKEPYTWYIIKLMSGGPVDNYLPPSVDYQAVFRMINDLLVEGKYGEEILNHHFIQRTIDALRYPRTPVYMSHPTYSPSYHIYPYYNHKYFHNYLQPNHIFFSPPHPDEHHPYFFHVYPNSEAYEGDRNMLREMINRSGMRTDSMLNDEYFNLILNHFKRYDPNFPPLDRESFKYYLNYLITTYGRDSKSILEEPYTWYVMRLMSGGPVENYLPVDVDYQKVFRTLNQLVNVEGKHGGGVIIHPYITRTVRSLHRPYSPVYSPPHTYYPSNFHTFPTPTEYAAYHQNIMHLLDRYGKNTENILNDNEFWDIINGFYRYGGPQSLDRESVKYFLNYIINTYGARAQNMLREPYTWFLVRLMSGGPVETYLPLDVDYEKVFRIMNELVESGKYGDVILRHPYISHTIDSLRQPRFGQYAPSYPQFGQYAPSYPQFGQYAPSYPQFGQYAPSYPQFGQYAPSYPQFGQYATSYPRFGQYAPSYPRFVDGMDPYQHYPLHHGFKEAFFGPHGMTYKPYHEMYEPYNYHQQFFAPPHSMNFHYISPFPLPADYETFHTKLVEVVNRCGLEIETLLKDKGFWDIFNSFKNYDHSLVKPYDEESLRYYLNYLTNTFGNKAYNILKEPYVMYILRLMSGGPVKGYLPSDVDYQHVFNTFNQLINEQGVTSDGILNHPYIYHTVQSLRRPRSAEFYHGDHQYSSYPFSPLYNVKPYQTYMPKVDYDGYHVKLNTVIDRCGLKPETILKDNDFWDILKSFHNYEGSYSTPLDNETLKYYLNYLINTFGSKSGKILKEPYFLYVLKMMSGGPANYYLPEDINYQQVFNTFNELINDKGVTGDAIVKHPYISHTIDSIRKRRSADDLPGPTEHFDVPQQTRDPSTGQSRYPFPAKPQYPFTGESRYPFSNQRYSFDGRTQFPFYGQRYPFNGQTQYPFNGQTQYPFSEQRYPYNGQTQYPFSGQRYAYNGQPQYPFSGQRYSYNGQTQYPFSGQRYPYNGHTQYPFPGRYPYNGHTQPSFPGQFPFDGKTEYTFPGQSQYYYQGQTPYSSYPYSSMKFQGYSTPTEYENYHKKLITVIDRCGLKPDTILKDKELWEIVNTFNRVDGGLGFPVLDKESFRYYLNYIINKYGNGAGSILKEPYTWYLLRLMSGGAPESYLPYDVDYGHVFSTLDQLINRDNLHSQAILSDPYISQTISSLRHPRDVTYTQGFGSPYPFSTLSVDNFYQKPIDYPLYHRQLNKIIEKCGLKPDVILKEPDLWPMINDIRHSNGIEGFPLLDKNTFAKYLNFIITHFPQDAATMLEEPYTWYILSLLGQSEVNGVQPVGIDYQDILTKLNNYIVKDGYHGEDIVRRPYLSYIANSLQNSNGNGFRPYDVDYRPFYRMLDELIKSNGNNVDKELKEHYLWYIVNALQHSTGEGYFPKVDYKVFNNLLEYIKRAYGENAVGILREPYTWYVLSLLSDGSVSYVARDGLLPSGVDYKTFYHLLNYLIKTHGKNAEEILKQPYVWYVLNTLKSGSTPVRYGQNVNEVEELTNLDGTQYVVYSHYNKTWVHPVHGKGTGGSVYFGNGEYGQYENKLMQLINAVLQRFYGTITVSQTNPDLVVTTTTTKTHHIKNAGTGETLVVTQTAEEPKGGAVMSGGGGGVVVSGGGSEGGGEGGGVVVQTTGVQHAPGAAYTIIPGQTIHYSTSPQFKVITTHGGGGGGGGLLQQVGGAVGGLLGGLAQGAQSFVDSRFGGDEGSTSTVVQTVGGGSGSSSYTIGGGGNSGSTITTIGGGGNSGSSYTIGGGGNSGSTITTIGGGGNSGSSFTTIGGGGTSGSSYTTTIGGNTGTGTGSLINLSTISNKNGTNLETLKTVLSSLTGDKDLVDGGSDVKIQWSESKPKK